MAFIHRAKPQCRYAAESLQGEQLNSGDWRPGGEHFRLSIVRFRVLGIVASQGARACSANCAKTQELYGDRWPRFAESDLHRWLEAAGFKKIEINIVAHEEQPPHFETVMASGQR